MFGTKTKFSVIHSAEPTRSLMAISSLPTAVALDWEKDKERECSNKKRRTSVRLLTISPVDYQCADLSGFQLFSGVCIRLFRGFLSRVQMERLVAPILH